MRAATLTTMRGYMIQLTLWLKQKGRPKMDALYIYFLLNLLKRTYFVWNKKQRPWLGPLDSWTKAY